LGQREKGAIRSRSRVNFALITPKRGRKSVLERLDMRGKTALEFFECNFRDGFGIGNRANLAGFGKITSNLSRNAFRLAHPKNRTFVLERLD
jgi:hypothetical protein